MKKALKNLIASLGYKLSSTKYVLKPFENDVNILALNFDHVLSKYLFDKGIEQHFSFMQIGTFDGIECDPLRKYLLKYRWSGLMIEPQPLPYKKLQEEYADRAELLLLNAAISPQCKKTILYTLESNEIPEWAKGMASFNKEVILKHQPLFPNIGKYIKEIEVDAVSFEHIFNTYGIKHIDVLQIDTEGYDAQIIQMFPFDRICPAIIHFESKHIPKAELEKTLNLLLAKGYKIGRDGDEDMTALLSE